MSTRGRDVAPACPVPPPEGAEAPRCRRTRGAHAHIHPPAIVHRPLDVAGMHVCTGGRLAGPPWGEALSTYVRS